MGLSCAFEAAVRGERVAVLDPNPVGRKASWAAAGILAARAGVVGGSPFREFYLRALAAYPPWLARVEAESGMPVPFRRGGDHQIFPVNAVEARRLREARERQLQREKAAAFTVSDELPAFLQGHAAVTAARVFHFPDEAWVQNRVLLAALAAALGRRNAEIFTLRPKSLSAGRLAVVRGPDWELRARRLLVAAGVWSNEALRPLGWSAPLVPVKGQLALLPNFHGHDGMVHCLESLYLVPRDGHLIAGATTEAGVDHEGFDAAGDAYLRAQLQRYFPRVEPTWVETWSGLRPRTRDRLPLMGWVDAARTVALCTGHYKSGISTAPLAARCMVALLREEKPPADLQPFDPLRRGGLQPIG